MAITSITDNDRPSGVAINGRFLLKTRTCRNCGAIHPSYEEKKTDVNIACQILNDTHLDHKTVEYKTFSEEEKREIVFKYDYVFVDEEGFNKYKPKNFKALMSGFRDYKE